MTSLFLLLFTWLTPPNAPFQTGLMADWLSPTKIEMGDLAPKVPQTVEFKFRNISGDSLFIDNVRAGCGCTVPDWSYDPVAPDSVSIIQVEYDAYKTGYFSEKIKVYFRGQRKADLLWIEGYVLEE